MCSTVIQWNEHNSLVIT